MALGLLDIDHLVIRVAQLAGSVERFGALGFTVAPERSKGSAGGEMRPPFAMRHVLFDGFPGRNDIANFLVLQCVEQQYDVPVPASQLMGFMNDTEGPRAIICYSEDLDVSRAAMEEIGIETAPSTWRIEESWEDDGETLAVKSRPLIPLARRTPFFIGGFQTETLPSFRHPTWTNHRNGARYIAGVTGVSDNLAEDVEILADRVFGVEPEWVDQGHAVIKPRDLFLRVVTPEGFASLYPDCDFSRERILPALCGVTFAVDSLDKVSDVLAEGGIPHARSARGAVVVPRAEAANTLLEFVAAESR